MHYLSKYHCLGTYDCNGSFMSLGLFFILFVIDSGLGEDTKEIDERGAKGLGPLFQFETGAKLAITIPCLLCQVKNNGPRF